MTLGPGIEVGDTGHLDKFFLRLLEARDGIALPGFRLPPLAAFFCFPLLPPPWLLLRALCGPCLLRALGARGFHPAPLVERRILGPRAAQPLLELIEIFEVAGPA